MAIALRSGRVPPDYLLGLTELLLWSLLPALIAKMLGLL